MSRVFIVHDQTRRDPLTGSFERTKDFSSASEYGELIHVLPMGRVPDPEAMLGIIREKLADYTEDDFLLFTGAPEAIAIAATIAMQSSGGRIRWLWWRRRGYEPSPYIDLSPATESDIAKARRLLAEEEEE